jgi:hypothetical protein
MLNRNAATMEGALTVPAVIVDFSRKPTEKNGQDAETVQRRAAVKSNVRVEDLKSQL